MLLSAVAPPLTSAEAGDEPSCPNILADHAVSTAEGIEFSHQFDHAPQPARFFFIVPFDREITCEIRAAEAQVTRDGTTQTLDWSRLQSGEEGFVKALTARFNSMPQVCVSRHFRVMELRLDTVTLKSGKQEIALRNIECFLKFDKPADPPGVIAGYPVFDPALRSHQIYRDELMAGFVSNLDGLQLYGAADPPSFNRYESGASELPARPLGLRPLLRIETSRDGLYQITRKTLLQAGLDPDAVDPRNLHLMHRGEEIPTETIGGLAGSFTAQDALLCYLGANTSEYSKYSVYYLVEDAAAQPLRMPVVRPEIPAETQPRTLYRGVQTVEQDQLLIKHTDTFLAIKDYNWCWQELPQNETVEIEFDAPHLAETSGSVQMKIGFYLDEEQLEPAADVKVELSGHSKTFSLKNLEELEFEFELPAGVLKPKDNRMTFQRLEGSDEAGVYLDFVRIAEDQKLELEDGQLIFQSGATLDASGAQDADAAAFRLAPPAVPLPLILDVTDPRRPQYIAYASNDARGLLFGASQPGDRTYLVQSLALVKEPERVGTPAWDDALSQTEPVEYLIISHADFIQPAERLADFHRRNGLRSRVVDVQSIYNHLDGGHESPLAIKGFLDYTMRHWAGGGPMYVVLMGDATSDYRGDFRNDVRNFVPSYVLHPASGIDFWASDHYYTVLCGDDLYSDIMLGRISVANVPDAYTVVNKTIQYLSDPAPGPWRETLTMVADNGEFDDDCEDLRRQFIPPHYTVNRVYLDREPLAENSILPLDKVEADRLKISPQATTKIMDAFNRGALFVSYHGHGSPNIWSDEKLWFGGDSLNSDNLMLKNRARPPLLVNMTCNSGAIDYPDPPWNICITEDMMRVKNGGVIGCYVPTGPGIPSSHRKVCAVLFNILFTEQRRYAGPALLLSQYRYLAFSYPEDMAQMFLFLGDPALVLPQYGREERIALPVEVVRDDVQTTITARHKFEGMPNAFVQAALYNENDEPAVQWPRERLRGGALEKTFAIPQGASTGEWHLRAYAWDADGSAAIAWAPVEVGQPFLRLKEFKTVKPVQRIYQPGGLVDCEIVIHNPSRLPVTDGLLEISDQTQARLEVWKESFHCAAGETVRVTVALPVKETATHRGGLQVYRAELKNYIAPPESGEESGTMLALALPAGDAAKPNEVRISTNAWPVQAVKNGRNIDVDWPLIIVAAGENGAQRLDFTLEGSAGPAIKAQCDPLQPGQQRIVRLKGRVQAKRMPVQLKLECSPGDVLAPGTMLSRMLTNRDLPDLAIDASKIESWPEEPVESETIFFRVPVYNHGDSAATNVKVDIYERNPDYGNPAFARPQVGERQQIERLAPGERRDVIVRWDPWSNAGQKTVWFKADSDNRNDESDENDNIGMYSVTAKTKYKLIPEGITVRPLGEDKLLELQAAIANEGESDARSVLIEFFLGDEQTPQNKLGQVIAPVVPAGSKVVAPYLHRLTPEDEQRLRAAGGRITYRAGLKGSLQRISSVGQ